MSDDTNGVADAFVFDRNSSTTRRISTDQLGQQLATGGTFPVVSANGAFVTFATESLITGLGVATQRQLYVRLTVPLNPGSLPAVSVGNATVAEGNTKIRQVRFTVTLSKPSAAPTSVSFATFPGTTTRVAIGNASVVEGNTGTRTMRFAVTARSRSRPRSR